SVGADCDIVASPFLDRQVIISTSTLRRASDSASVGTLSEGPPYSALRPPMVKITFKLVADLAAGGSGLAAPGGAASPTPIGSRVGAVSGRPPQAARAGPA